MIGNKSPSPPLDPAQTVHADGNSIPKTARIAKITVVAAVFINRKNSESIDPVLFNDATI
jgi:hypothetical protein